MDPLIILTYSLLLFLFFLSCFLGNILSMDQMFVSPDAQRAGMEMEPLGGDQVMTVEPPEWN